MRTPVPPTTLDPCQNKRQRAEKIIEENPTLNNRELARLAQVDEKLIRMVKRKDASPSDQTVSVKVGSRRITIIVRIES